MRERRLWTYLLLVLLVAATVPALVVGTYEFLRVRRSYADSLDVQHARAAAISQEVSTYVDTHARAVRTLARQLETTGDVSQLDLQRILDTLRDEYPGIVGTFIGDAEGNALAFSPPVDLSGRPLAGRNYKNATYFQPLMSTKQMVYSDVIPGAVINGNPLVTMVVPILDRQGNVRNYISGGLNLSRLAGRLAAHSQYPGEIILLVDNKDTLVGHSGQVNYDAFAKLSEQLHIRKMRSNLSWWENETELGGYAVDPRLGWGVAIITPRTAFYANLQSTVTHTAMTVGLALVLGWAMALFLARKMNQPITDLMKAALAVRRGDMQARVSTPRRLLPKEMAELHDSFNAMVAALQQHQADLLRLNATLEERVEERTREVIRRSQELAVLNATAASVTGVLDLEDRLQEMARHIVQLVGADVGVVILRHRGGPLNIEAVYCPKIRWRPPLREELSTGMAAEIIARGQPTVVLDVALRRHLFGAWADDYPHASFIGVPMRASGDIVGILGAISVQSGYFDDHSVELLSALAGQVGPAVAGAWLFAEAQEQRNTLLSITNSMHEGLLLVDPGHRVQFANTAAATLLNLDGPPVPDTLLADFCAHCCGDIATVLTPPAGTDGGGAVPSVDVELPGPPPRTLAATAFPVMGQGLTHLGYGILLRDVTQERQLERSKDELLANVSHELRTPLTTILGNAATLLHLRASMEPEEQSEFLEGIAAESRRLKELIESVLDMSRISSGSLQLDRHHEPWQPLVKRALQRARQRWPGHHFEALVPPNLPLVVVDAGRMEQVLDNLLNNAAQYSPSGSAVAVTVTAQDGLVLTSVRDTGEGIDPKCLEQVFDRFFRGDSPQVRRVRGTGLGLAICRGIVDAHGGRIWAESERGRGSTFTFSLPAVAGDARGGVPA